MRGFILRSPYLVVDSCESGWIGRTTSSSSSPNDLSRTALEALAIDAYRRSRISGHQLCQLFEIPSQYELDGFLKHHGVPLEYTFEDFESEGATSARLWQKRQEELAAERDRERRPE